MPPQHQNPPRPQRRTANTITSRKSRTARQRAALHAPTEARPVSHPTSEYVHTDGTRSIRSFDDLDMGDYQRSLENPGSWAKLGWPLDRVAFVKRLDELRGVRNDVMHFNPDPVPPDSVDKLRNILSMLRQYCD